LRAALGRAARAYAEATFDTALIADRFEDVIERAVGPSVARARAGEG
jgi:hypothetical protein